MHRAARGLRPYEPAALQALAIKVHAIAAPPQKLQQIAALTAEHEYVTREGTLAQRRLHQRRQTIHAFAHIGYARREPHPSSRGQCDHSRDSTSITACNASVSTPPHRRMRAPYSSISIAAATERVSFVDVFATPLSETVCAREIRRTLTSGLWAG